MLGTFIEKHRQLLCWAGIVVAIVVALILLIPTMGSKGPSNDIPSGSVDVSTTTASDLSNNTTEEAPPISTTIQTSKTNATTTLTSKTSWAPIEGKQYFTDLQFSRGFLSDSNTYLKFDDNSQTPMWALGQNDSKHLISSAKMVVNTDGSREYTNLGKTIRMYDSYGSKALQLAVYGDKEYDRPRQDGEAWPHLLIGQVLSKRVLTPIHKYDKLIYSMDVKIGNVENCMSKEDYEPGAHCAQTTAYLTIQNLQSGSSGFGDYIWFGIPIYDSRSTFPAEFYLLDEGGKHDATGKIIYVLGGQDFLDRQYGGINPADGEWAHCEVDILPFVKQALETAQKAGHMKNTTFSDLRIGEFNIGWEVTGTFRCSMDIKNISLIGVTD